MEAERERERERETRVSYAASVGTGAEQNVTAVQSGLDTFNLTVSKDPPKICFSQNLQVSST